MIRIKSHAKVNLHLQVVGRREDGYHLLNTVFARISLADEILLEAIRDPKIELVVNGPFSVPSGPANIAYKAARWYLSRYGINWGVKIVVNKLIPPGSGLGAGSSNAAAVIKGMARFFKEWDEKIIEDSAELGADVPFFLLDKTFAYAEGIGEVLKPLELSLPFKVAVVYPGFGVSTKEAFDLYDQAPKNTNCLSRDEIEAIVLSGDLRLYRKKLFNHLEEPVFRKYEMIAELKKRLEAEGAEFCLMSGSGSSVYGLFSGEKKLALDHQVFYCEFI